MARPLSAAQKRFAAWLESLDSQRQAAELLGISQSFVNKIANGQKTPKGMAVMRAIERATKGIPGGAIRPDDWEVAAREPKAESAA